MVNRRSMQKTKAAPQEISTRKKYFPRENYEKERKEREGNLLLVRSAVHDLARRKNRSTVSIAAHRKKRGQQKNGQMRLRGRNQLPGPRGNIGSRQRGKKMKLENKRRKDFTENRGKQGKKTGGN